MHELARFLTARHADDNSPLSTFTRKYAEVLPARGGLDELRAALVEHMQAKGKDFAQIGWDTSCLEVAWDKAYPSCTSRDCPALALPDSTFCAGHRAERGRPACCTSRTGVFARGRAECRGASCRTS